MKLALQIISWVGVVMGAFALLGSITEYDPYAVIGGALFFLQGLFALIYIDQVSKTDWMR